MQARFARRLALTRQLDAAIAHKQNGDLGWDDNIARLQKLLYGTDTPARADQGAAGRKFIPITDTLHSFFDRDDSVEEIASQQDGQIQTQGGGYSNIQDDELRTPSTITGPGLFVIFSNPSSLREVIEISMQPSSDCNLQLFDGTVPMSARRFIQANLLWSAPGKTITRNLILTVDTGATIQVEVRSKL